MLGKKLTPGQRYVVEGISELNAQFSVSTSNDCGFQFSVPGVDSRRRGNRIATRNLVDTTKIIVTPEGEYFPSRTTLFVSLTLLEEQRENDLQIDFPPFDVSNLSTFTLGSLTMTPAGLVLEAAELSEDVGLDSTSSEIRSVARSTVGVESLSETRKRNTTLILDVSTSMGRSLKQEQFIAMCQFASGVLAVAAADRRISFCTSSAKARPMVIHSNDVESIPSRNFQFTEAGWNLDMDTIDPQDALVIISDDIPAALSGWDAVHVLTPRQPIYTGATYTLFDAALIQAVQSNRSDILARETETMLKTLTGEK